MSLAHCAANASGAHSPASACCTNTCQADSLSEFPRTVWSWPSLRGHARLPGGPQSLSRETDFHGLLWWGMLPDEARAARPREKLRTSSGAGSGASSGTWPRDTRSAQSCFRQCRLPFSSLQSAPLCTSLSSPCSLESDERRWHPALAQKRSLHARHKPIFSISRPDPNKAIDETNWRLDWTSSILRKKFKASRDPLLQTLGCSADRARPGARPCDDCVTV